MDRIFGRDLTNILQPLGLRNFVSKQFKSNKSFSEYEPPKYIKSIDRLPEKTQTIQLKDVRKQDVQKWGKKPQTLQKIIKNNIQMVPQYFSQCIKFVLQQQRIAFKFNSHSHLRQNSSCICDKTRGQIIDWISQIHQKFKMSTPSLYMSVMIIDKYLLRKSINKGESSVLAAAAIYIAAKYEQTYQVPRLSELVTLSPKCITKKQILQMQADIITAFDFNLIMQTSYQFFAPFAKLAELQGKSLSLALYILQISLLHPKFSTYRPSIIASSTIFLVNKIVNKQCQWPEVVKLVTNLDQSDLKNCAKQLCIVFEKINQIPYAKNIKKKYSTEEHHHVSRLLLERKKQ